MHLQCRRHRRPRFDPWVRKIPGKSECNPFQSSCLENPMDREGWWAAVHGFAKGQTRLKHLSMCTHTHTHLFIVAVKSLSHVQLFYNPMDCSLPGSSVHGVSQARVLEWAAISFARGSSWPQDRTVSCIGKQILHPWAPRVALYMCVCMYVYTHTHTHSSYKAKETECLIAK